MAQGDPYDAVGGSFTAPGITTVVINQGRCGKRALKMQNITGPGDNGSVKWKEGNYRYAFTGNGVYAEGSTATATLDDGVTGTGTVQLGNGEQWSGPAIIQQVDANAEWGPGGAIGVQLAWVWNGTPTIDHPV